MRTSLDIPDPLFRHLKAKAALEGSTLRDLVLNLVQRGLNSSNSTAPLPTASDLPSISLGAPMVLSAEHLSNANLSALADE
ncbi:hypothetical protein [Rhodoferax sp.]|uniref:hypothetical protein n=1 Tax=Rhodoferax sp. TaxID=50421 RepID=UPI0025EEE811|nr:hypothetical protein [Rhodoferax sp.]MCM2341447.1 hypothetical protein [Rhodoferax sp.]